MRLKILIGISGSGKSTWAENYVRIHPEYHIVSTDQMRKTLLGSESDQSNGAMIFRNCYEQIRQHLMNNEDVIFDATNLTRKARKEVMSKVSDLPVKFDAVYFDMPLSKCILNQEERSRKVPKEVIEKQFNKLTAPDSDEGWDDIFYPYSYYDDDSTCVICGAYVPEGTMICHSCYVKIMSNP